MAISKEAAEKAQRDLHAETITRWEAHIDQALAKGDRTVAVPNRNNYVIDVITNKYKQVGWTVRYISDQRDGDYLEFS